MLCVCVWGGGGGGGEREREEEEGGKKTEEECTHAPPPLLPLPVIGDKMIVFLNLNSQHVCRTVRSGSKETGKRAT